MKTKSAAFGCPSQYCRFVTNNLNRTFAQHAARRSEHRPLGTAVPPPRTSHVAPLDHFASNDLGAWHPGGKDGVGELLFILVLWYTFLTRAHKVLCLLVRKKLGRVCQLTGLSSTTLLSCTVS